jgi:hypothetical protein
MEENCGFCGHPMTSHNRTQYDGPVCMWCACGDEFVVDHLVPEVGVVRELVTVVAIAVVIMAAIWTVMGLLQFVTQ